jgi:PAS domain S-box-containing protein
MEKIKPTYEQLLHENLSLKLELAKVQNNERLYNEMALKNIELEEMNEEMKQIFEQLKQSKIELEKAENLYKLVSTNITDVIWIIDLEGNFTYLSPSAQKLFGYTPRELEKITTKDVLTTEGLKKQREVIAARLEKEKRGEITSSLTNIVQHKRKNGEVFWAEINSSPMRDENNRIVGIMGVTRDISGRKSAEDKMNMLSVAVDQNPASIVLTKLDGSIEYVNQAFTATTGYTLEEVIGKDPRILKSGQTQKKVYKDLWNSIMNGKVWHGEFVNKKKNGELYYENATIAPIKDNDGSITHFVAIKENVTSKKFDQQNLKKSQERYKLLADISQEGILIFENGLVVDTNQSFHRITGFDKSKVLETDPLPMLFTQESVEVIKEKIETLYNFPFEITGIRKDRTNYPAELEIKQLKYQGRDLMVTSLRDLSYRKRLEEVLRSSLRLTEMISDKTENQIIEWGLEEAVRLSDSNIGFFHYVNDDQLTINLHVWSKQTLENCDVPEKKLHYPISQAGTWVDSFHERKPVVHNDYSSLKTKKGLPEGHFPLIRYISLPVIEGNKVKIIFGVGNKLDNYNQFDVDVLSLFAKTIWMVIQRKRTEQELSDANETKSKFLSIISHDLRSPLGSIHSLAEMIVDNREILPVEEIFEFIQVISQTSKSTYEQLENMLTWSKSQTKKLEFRPEQIDLNEFIRQQIKSTEYLSKKKEIQLEFISGLNLSVKADKNMLTSIFRNLFSNAIKFTPPKGRVSVSFKQNHEEWVEILVADTGIGIEASRIKNIFNLGRSSSTFGTENEKGSGLGLLLCKEFIEKNNGTIRIESEPGKGTRIYFTLPLF